MPSAHEQYLRQLMRSLEAAGLSGRRIGGLTAEIAAHLADTDADPVEELGTPAELAKSLAADEHQVPLWLRSLPTRVVAMTMIMVAMDFVLAALLDRPVTSGSLSQATGIGALTLIFRRVAGVRLDGRSMWSAITPTTIAVLLGGAAIISTAAMTSTTLASPNPIEASIVGVPLAAGGVALLWASEGRIQFPAGSEYLKRLARPSLRM